MKSATSILGPKAVRTPTITNSCYTENRHDVKTANDFKAVNHQDSSSSRWNFKDVPMTWDV
ncbi:MAG: hypothetical protein O4805_21120 [Trichodesmium sp. St16_bin2-tuft]|nr:hypothetical protein [Trichodesmium sp. MAG_R02]MDE5089487.1 hypothetical protein [Trichodesmium sp. St16_bin2-tuft]MDE5105567.1 hypothetical protein [Trichodesmium sp. St17_bin3_1_1]MDE5121322.1 hypothetical protein [Trichodesmium sp. St19_bin1]